MSIHLPRAFKQEPEEDKKQRIKGMKKELAEYLDDEGHLIVYRGSFERPFGREEDASRVIEKGFALQSGQRSCEKLCCMLVP